jgi:hypothetical protein
MSYDERANACPENAIPSDGQVKVVKMFSLKNEEYKLKKKE